MAQSTETKLNKRFDQNIEITGTLNTVGNITVTSSTPSIILVDTDTSNPDNQSIRLYHEGIDANLPDSEGLALVLDTIDATGTDLTPSLIVAGNIYAEGLNRVATRTWATSTFLQSVPSEYLTQTEGDNRYLQSFTETDTLQSVTDRGASTTNALTITSDTFTNIYSATEGVEAGLKFSSLPNRTQYGNLSFQHTDTLSYGSAASFKIGSSEATTTILADGKLMYKEGIYSKPATGTGAGTRKDANWDSAYSFTSTFDITDYTDDKYVRADVSDTKNGDLSIVGGHLYMNNNNIYNVNHITINDAGVGEGIEWAGGNGWKIYESPNALTNAAGNLQFVTGSTRRMTIDTSGNLDVTAGITSTSLDTDSVTISAASGGLYFTGGNNRIYFTGYRAMEGATNGSTLQIGEGYSATRMYNSVGINAAPSYALHAYHPTTNVVGQFESGDNNAWISVRDDGYTTFGAMLGCNNDLGMNVIIAGNGANKFMTIDNNGNTAIGLGDTLASHKLHVLGSTRFDSYSISDPDATSIANYPAAHTFTHYSEANGMAIIGGQGSYAGTTLMLGQETDSSSAYNYIECIGDTNGTQNQDFIVRGDGRVYAKKLLIGTTGEHGLVTLNWDRTVSFAGRMWHSGTVNDLGAGVANGVAITLNELQGTTLTGSYHYRVWLTTTGTGTYQSSMWVIYRNSADTAWVARAVSNSSNPGSNYPQLAISGNNALAYDEHTSTYTVRYRVESIYTGQAKTSEHILGSDVHWQRTYGNLWYGDGNVGIAQNKYLYFDNTGHYIRRATNVELSSSTGLDFQISGGSAMYINGSKKVGINTTGQTALLQIGAGTTNASNRSDVALFGASNSGGLVDALGLINTASGTYNNGVALNFHNGNTWSPTGAIRLYQVPSGGVTSSIMKFYTYNSGLHERMAIDEDGDVSMYRTAYIGSTSTNHGGGGYNLRLDAADTSSIGFHDSGSTMGSITFSAAQGGFIIGGTHGGYGTHKVTTGSDLIVSGDLGVGCTDPQTAMEIRGNAPFLTISNLTEDDAGIYFNDYQAGANPASSSQAAAIKFNSSNNQLSFYNNDVNNAALIIGTDSISYFQGSIYTISGSVANLSIRLGDSNTGFYDSGSNTIGVVCDGSLKYNFESNGTFRAAGDVVAYYSFSDKRLKTNIKPLQNSLEKIKALQGVSYEWKDGERKGKAEVGLIAQEVEKIVPEVVREQKRLGDDTEYKTVDYEKLTAVLIEAVKELTNKVEELENKLNGTTH
jgi:hypothetical protein